MRLRPVAVLKRVDPIDVGASVFFLLGVALTVGVAWIGYCKMGWIGILASAKPAAVLIAVLLLIGKILKVAYVNTIRRFTLKPNVYQVYATETHSVSNEAALDVVRRFFGDYPQCLPKSAPSILSKTWWRKCRFRDGKVSAELTVSEDAHAPYRNDAIGKLYREAQLSVTVSALDANTLRFEWQMTTACDPMGPLMDIIDFTQRQIDAELKSDAARVSERSERTPTFTG